MLAPGQLRLSSRELQLTALDCFTLANGNSELGVIFFIQAVVLMRPDTTSQVTARREIVTLPMGWQEEEAELSSEQHKQFNPGE